MKSPAAEIRAEIEQDGPISFARFMEKALYAPGSGYYERPREIGRRGDFFTSVSVGPVFGALLAFQFARWLEEIAPSASGRRQLVEAGAHDGQLALDVLNWLRQRKPEIFASVDYWMIEPSPVRRAAQEKKLEGWPNVKWVKDTEELGALHVQGIIFSNELLDAMPVHRLCWDAMEKKWMEWSVDWKSNGFGWQKTPLSKEAAACLPAIDSAVEAVLPDGFIIELSPGASRWWTRAAGSLGNGKLLAVDYGFGDDEWLRPGLSTGTLRAYRGHRISENVLEDPGEQDITAHVNFPIVHTTGEAAGLRIGALVRQSKFLTEIFQSGLKEGTGFQDWTSAEIRQFQTLTHPEHLGHRFRVLVQER